MLRHRAPSSAIAAAHCSTRSPSQCSASSRSSRSLTFRDYGLSWDDYTHAEYGDLLLALYASGFADQRALSFVNLYMYGGGFDLLAALAAKVLPFTCSRRAG